MQQLTHDEARAWLAERLDWRLEEARLEALEAHLAGCPACRAVGAEYGRDRAALRQLRAPQPPRDLWARTAAALDREPDLRRAAPAPGAEATRPRPARARPAPSATTRGRRRRLGFGPAFASLTAVAVALIAGSQILPGGLLGPRPVATPIALAPEPLAYIAVQGNQVVLVRSSLDHVCPPEAIDCSDLPAGVNQVVAVPAQVALSALAVDSLGEHAAVAGQQGNQTTYYVISLPPLPLASPPALPSASGVNATLEAGASGTAAGSGGSGASPGWAAAGSPSVSPAVSVGTNRPASQSPGPKRTRSPATTGSPAAVRTHEVSHASATPTPAHATATARRLASPGASRTVSPAASAATGTPAASGAPEIAVTQIILSDVVPTGLPAAWAPDGSTLAFSAMPADGSHGSDIYTWRPGDVLAVPVTHDHDSYFASWAGNRIVGSKALSVGGDPLHLQASSFVIDPATGQQRPLRLDNVWLPSVDPTGRFVAFWRGDLAGSGALPSLGRGELDFEQWSALDPLASNAPSGPATTPTPAPSPARSAASNTSPEITTTPAPHRTVATPHRVSATTAAPGATGTPRERIPDLLTPTPNVSPAPTPTGPQPIFPPASPSTALGTSGALGAETGSPPQSSGSSEAIGSIPPTPTLEPLPSGSVEAVPPAVASSPESSGATPGEAATTTASAASSGAPAGALASASTASAVIGDYAIAWASDGSALGVWRADTPGALDGLLSVFSIDASTGTLAVDPPFLGPTPAQRFFSMGSDRIAWTTPPDLFGSCQLHVVAWGPFGRGELRRSLSQQRLLTAF